MARYYFKDIENGQIREEYMVIEIINHYAEVDNMNDDIHVTQEAHGLEVDDYIYKDPNGVWIPAGSSLMATHQISRVRSPNIFLARVLSAEAMLLAEKHGGVIEAVQDKAQPKKKEEVTTDGPSNL